ncbi:hypothetical protein F5Y07DRAFT_347800 [Xylaria sp. FL0933]|nr:hypothetical protein F5Y07DRAFT_347800 [Xylaria sp. FL0933]
MPTRPPSHLLTAIRQLYHNLGYQTYRIRSPWHRGMIVPDHVGKSWSTGPRLHLELFVGHFQLLVLGVIGCAGLTNVRDFQILVAFFNRGLIIDGDQRRSLSLHSSERGEICMGNTFHATPLH